MDVEPSIEGRNSVIHVVIADMPEMWLELLKHYIGKQTDMVVDETVQGTINLLMAAKEADVVILGTEQIVEQPPSICSHLLNEQPFLKIIVCAFQNDEATFYWLGLHQKRIKLQTGQALTQWIRILANLDAVS